MELTALAQRAYDHWKEHLPKTVKRLEETGKLKEILEEAAETAWNEMGQIRDHMMANSPRPKNWHENLAREYRMRNVSEEIVLPRYILLPPKINGLTINLNPSIWLIYWIFFFFKNDIARVDTAHSMAGDLTLQEFILSC